MVVWISFQRLVTDKVSIRVYHGMSRDEEANTSTFIARHADKIQEVCAVDFPSRQVAFVGSNKLETMCRYPPHEFA